MSAERTPFGFDKCVIGSIQSILGALGGTFSGAVFKMEIGPILTERLCASCYVLPQQTREMVGTSPKDPFTVSDERHTSRNVILLRRDRPVSRCWGRGLIKDLLSLLVYPMRKAIPRV